MTVDFGDKTLEQLYPIHSLHYEKKQGKMKGLEAVWINDQYRLLFKSYAGDQGIIINISLIEISKHYE